MSPWVPWLTRRHIPGVFSILVARPRGLAPPSVAFSRPPCPFRGLRCPRWSLSTSSSHLGSPRPPCPPHPEVHAVPLTLAVRFHVLVPPVASLTPRGTSQMFSLTLVVPPPCPWVPSLLLSPLRGPHRPPWGPVDISKVPLGPVSMSSLFLSELPLTPTVHPHVLFVPPTSPRHFRGPVPASSSHPGVSWSHVSPP